MPRNIDRTFLAEGLPLKNASILLDSFKDFVVTKSSLSPCNLCAVSAPHNMRTRLLRCSCEACKGVASFAPCTWWGKTQQCYTINIMSVWECGSHLSLRRPAKPIRMTEPMKEVAREMAAHNHKPLRIRSALIRRFQLDESSLLSPQCVQRFVQAYRTKHLGGSDYVDDVRASVRENGFRGREDWCEPFTFTWNTDWDGLPVVGNGGDSSPLIVGITSKRLLERLNRDPATLMLHVDATFQLNQVAYQVVVVGISDCMRQFHLVALFITSQLTQFHFAEAFSALQRVYSTVLGGNLVVRYAMTDADDAQLNALQQQRCTTVHGACHWSSLPVLQDVGDVHFATSAEEFEVMRSATTKPWAEDPQLAPFETYFTTHWLDGRFQRWQIFNLPPGFAATNIPAEQYNRAIKGDYTLSARLKIGALLDQLLQCCHVESMKQRVFVEKPTPSPTLLCRVRELRRSSKLRELRSGRASIGFLLGQDEDADNIASILSERCDRVYDPESKRTRECLPVTARVSVHAARMEIYGMPASGWRVDLQLQWCPCRIYAKNAFCIHSVFALASLGQLNLSKHEKLGYRSRNRVLRCAAQHQEAGRPAGTGHALDIA